MSSDIESLGEKTRQLLQNMGVESPTTQGKVKVAPGLWVIPKPGADIEKLKEKYKK